MYLSWQNINFEVPVTRSEKKLPFYKEYLRNELLKAYDSESPMINPNFFENNLVTYNGNRKEVLH